MKKLFPWWRLQDYGVLMPYRTYKAAKQNGLPLSLVCALLVLNEPWRQKGNLEALPTLAEYIEFSGLNLGVTHFVETTANAVRVLSAMAYFQTQGID